MEQSMNAAQEICETCERPIPRDAPEGLCPACITSDLFGSPVDAGGDDEVGEQEIKVPGYRFKEKIGEGGHGEVFRAEQLSPHREVAIKILKLGMNSRQILARFEAEQQALAVLDHDAICRVLESGTTEDGRPFFAMVLSDGVPITDYCTDRDLSTRERLEIFIQVCDAINHAHQKAIVHRDLKPSNILVEDHEGAARVRIIDFGIAKALDEPLTERTMFTHSGILVGTPAYMSPEQAAGGMGVDIRSDVYSLGVVFYELLAGELPLEFDSETSVIRIQETLELEDPRRPSSRTSQKIAADLDWIALCALEKTCERRYQSAREMSADVERFLADEPILARPPSILYRLGRYVKRNRTRTIAAMLMALAIVTGATVSTVMAIRANRAEQVTRRAFSDADLSTAEHLVDRNNYADAVGYLCRSLRSEAGNLQARALLLEVLTETNFPLPVFAPLDLGGSGSCWGTFTPDGTRIITVSASGQARVWDALSGQALTPNVMAPTPVRGKIVVVADSSRFAIFGGADTKVARVFNTHDASLVAEFLDDGSDPLTAGMMAPDGETYVTGHRSGTIRGWALDSKKMIWSNDDGLVEGETMSCAIDPEGQTVASGFVSGRLRLLSLQDGEARADWRVGSHPLSYLTFAKDSDRILHFSNQSSRSGGSASCSFTSRGRATKDWVKHHDLILGLEPFADGRLTATVSQYGAAYIWDSNIGRILTGSIFNHPGAVTSLSWEPGAAQLATGSADGSARLWNIGIWQREETRGSLSPPIDHLFPVSDVEFSPSHPGHLLVCTGEGKLHLWDVRHRAAIYAEGGPEDYVDSGELPSWFLEMAEALVNREFSEAGQLQRVGFAQWSRVREEVLARDGSESIQQLSRWLVAPNLGRPSHPGSAISRAEYAQSLMKKGRIVSLQQANVLDPMNPQILRAISKNLMGNQVDFDNGEAVEIQRLADRIERAR